MSIKKESDIFPLHLPPIFLKWFFLQKKQFLYQISFLFFLLLKYFVAITDIVNSCFFFFHFHRIYTYLCLYLYLYSKNILYIKCARYRRLYVYSYHPRKLIFYICIPWNIYGVFTYVWSTYEINFPLNIYGLVGNWQIRNLNFITCNFLNKNFEKYVIF